MTKPTFESPDLTAQNIDKIAELFPNCVTEALDEERSTPEHKVYKKAVNFELLKQMLSPEVIDGEEAYEFTWVGKKAAIVEANKPIRKTLRPCPEESKNWDSTENLYIEGDNLEVLKLLQESYLGKVKMIYIDPPYNTGNDFIYRDDFAMDTEEYAEESGQLDEEGNRLFKNTDSNGRFHSDWCSMIYSRLMLARNLLTDDGVIFISIDDNEQENLKKICDEVFGENNFIGLFTIMSNPRGSQNSKYISSVHEYIIMYCRDEQLFEVRGISKDTESLNEFKETDKDGRKYRLLGLRKRGGAWRKEDRPNMYYSIFVDPTNGSCSLNEDSDHSIEVIPKRPTGELSRWTWGKDKFMQEKELLIGKKVNRSGEEDFWDVFRKDYIDNTDGTEKTTKIKTIWIEKDTNYQNAKNEIKDLFGNSEMFDYPKPIFIVSQLARFIGYDENDIILDFFSGSATTAHAVMQLNAEDNGHRKFIMVQLPEPCAEDSEAFKAGYKNICEIGKERIRRAGEKIVNDLKEKRYLYPGKSNPSNPEEILWAKETNAVNNQEGQKLMFSDSEGENKRKEAYSSDSYLYHPEKLDIGFRVLKLDDSNMKDVYYSPTDYNQQMLDGLESNIKDDRNDLDLLFGCLVDWNLPLSLPYTSEKIDGFTVHTYNDGDLIACFDENISDKAIKEIAKRQPLRVVFRDSSFNSSPEKINVREIFKMLAPDTRVKVI